MTADKAREEPSRNERRKFPRQPRNLSAVVYDLSENVLDLHSRIRDVNPQGLCIESDARFSLEECFRFTIDLPGAGAVSGMARTCWAEMGDGKPNLYGVHILSMLEEDLRRLRAFIGPMEARKKPG